MVALFLFAIIENKKMDTPEKNLTDTPKEKEDVESLRRAVLKWIDKKEPAIEPPVKKKIIAVKKEEISIQKEQREQRQELKSPEETKPKKA